MKGAIIDLFCGGGGASEGIRQALGRGPDYAIDSDADVLETHRANHPEAKHLCDDVTRLLDDVSWYDGGPCGLLWASPPCPDFSPATGKTGIKDRVRSELAWQVTRAAAIFKPETVIVENVVGFVNWGGEDMDGSAFGQWLAEFRKQGYSIETAKLLAADYGTPTIRKRLFIIATRGRDPVVPLPTHAEASSNADLFGAPLPWPAAGAHIDWSIPMRSVFRREAEGLKPLAERTMKRIAHGIQKHCLEPVIVEVANNGPIRTQMTSRNHYLAMMPYLLGKDIYPGDMERGLSESRGLDGAARLIQTTGKGGLHIINSCLINTAHTTSENSGRTTAADQPIGTVTAKNMLGVVGTFFAGKQKDWSPSEMLRSLDQPAYCLATKNPGIYFSNAFLFRGNYLHQPGMTTSLDEPTQTQRASMEIAVPFIGDGIHDHREDARELMASIGTTAHVEIAGHRFDVCDIGQRMLEPHEIAPMQGFPADYTLTGTKTTKYKVIGNSVCPPVAWAIVEANCK